MMERFLKLPAWILFIILLSSWIAPYGMYLPTVVLCCWLVFLGISVNRLVPSDYQFSNSWYIFRILFAGIYILIIDYYYGTRIPKSVYPFHIVASLFIFSSIWTSAKAIVLAETKKIQTFDRYIGTFFLLWFFPIGIWFVQPRLNRLAVN